MIDRAKKGFSLKLELVKNQYLEENFKIEKFNGIISEIQSSNWDLEQNFPKNFAEELKKICVEKAKIPAKSEL